MMIGYAIAFFAGILAIPFILLVLWVIDWAWRKGKLICLAFKTFGIVRPCEGCHRRHFVYRLRVKSVTRDRNKWQLYCRGCVMKAMANGSAT